MINTRSNNLDVVRCISNYLIIVMHASAALQYCTSGGAENDIWIFICGCLTQYALPALFLISGYLLFKNYSFESYPKKLVRRIKRLFVPYVVWNITFVGFFLACKSFVPRLAARVSSFGLDTLSGTFSKILSLTVHPIDGPLWFLRTLFILSLVSPLFYCIIKSNRTIVRYSGLLFIMIAYVVCGYMGWINSLLMTYPLYAITLFYVGGLLATSKKDVSLEFKSNLWLLPSVVGLGLMVLVIFSPQNADTPWYATFNDLGKLLMTPGLFYMVSKFNLGSKAENKYFIFAKDMSFFAYAGHFLFCSMLMHTTAPFLNSMTYGKATLLIFVFCLVGVPVMALIYKVGKRVIPHVMKLYDGTL